MGSIETPYNRLSSIDFIHFIFIGPWKGLIMHISAAMSLWNYQKVPVDEMERDMWVVKYPLSCVYS